MLTILLAAAAAAAANAITNTTIINNTNFVGHAVAEAVSPRPLTADARVQTRGSPCGVGTGHRGMRYVFLPVLQFSPVSIIPPYSFIYHPHCLMFFTQYFSFPLSVSFHHIHSSTTHTV